MVRSNMRPAFGDWRSLVAHFVRDEGVGGSNPLSPTKFKTLLNEQGFLHLRFMRMRTSGGREVRLERERENVAQQRPAGRATAWRVILWHRPNLKPCLTSRVFASRVCENETPADEVSFKSISRLKTHGIGFSSISQQGFSIAVSGKCQAAAYFAA